VFRNDYCFPTGFFFGENYDADDAFVSDESLSTFNAAERSLELINFIQASAKMRRSKKNTMIPFGCDFAYQNANEEYRNLERIIKYVN
jgi:lysosomal alpha-mannosidase